MIPGSANPLLLTSAAEAPGYNIERSLRFNSADSAYLSRTPSTAGNKRTYTYSAWVKRAALGSGTYYLFTAVDGSNVDIIGFEVDRFYWYNSFSGSVNSQALYRDPSAWYHMLASVDSTQAVATDRVKLYVNGAEVAYIAAPYPSLNRDFAVNNTVAHKVGQYFTTNSSDFYLADIHFIDGQALDPTSFGYTDTNGVWQPKAYTGTYPGNSFHLPFSDNSTTAALGTDTSGAGNDWTVNNISVTTGTFGFGFNDNGGTPYWIDVLPSNAQFDYSGAAGYLRNVTDGSTVSYVYWTGTASSASGNVYDIKFDLRDFPSISSIRLYYGWLGYGGSYDPYSVELLDANKQVISGTKLTLDQSGSSSPVSGWQSLTVLGSPRYLRIYADPLSSQTRLDLYGIEVNGTHLNSTSYASTNANATPYPNGDDLLDTPTNYGTDTGAGGEVRGNYATLNSVWASPNAALSNGNLELVSSGGSYELASSTIALTKKTYWETVVPASLTYYLPGIVRSDSQPLSSGSYRIGISATAYPNSATIWPNAQAVYYNGTSVYNTGNIWNPGNIIGHAFDPDTGNYYGWRNGSALNSGNPVATLSTSYTYAVALMTASTTDEAIINFGQRPFAYTAPSGYKALCTTNLDDPQTITTSGSYTGNGVADGPFVYLNGVPTAMTVNGNAVTFGTEADKLSNGFKVRTTSTTYNQNAVVYNYSIASTGDPFKRARAQSNP